MHTVSSAVCCPPRLANGDERALEESYRLYGPMVRGYLRRFVAGDEIDDLLQIVFLEVWRTRDRVDAEPTVRGMAVRHCAEASDRPIATPPP